MKLTLRYLTSTVLWLATTTAIAQQGNGTSVLNNFDPTKPLFRLQADQAENKNRFLRYVAVTGYREGVVPTKETSMVGFDVVNNSLAGTRRFVIYNSSIEDLITLGLTPPSHVLLHVKNPSRYRYDISYGDYKNWLRKNGYCYEQMVPQINMTAVQYVQDIAHCFALKVEKKKLSVKSLVLVRTSQEEKFKTTTDKEGSYSKTEFINQPFRRIGLFIESNGSKLPFVDQTNYPGYVDLNFTGASWTDISSIRKALQKYDLNLVEKDAEVEMLVISELK